MRLTTETPGGPDNIDRALIAALEAAAAGVKAALEAAGIAGLGDHVAAIIALSIRTPDERVAIGDAGIGLEGYQTGPLFTRLADAVAEHHHGPGDVVVHLGMN